MYSYNGEPKSVIGKDLAWDTIKRDFCRATKFIRWATVEGNKVKAMSSTMPYGYLYVESPRLPEGASMPITHKDDFKHLWAVFEERGVADDEEVLVVYDVPESKSIRLFPSVLPRLHVFVYEKGALEKISDYLENFSIEKERVEPIVALHPSWYKE